MSNVIPPTASSAPRGGRLPASLSSAGKTSRCTSVPVSRRRTTIGTQTTSTPSRCPARSGKAKTWSHAGAIDHLESSAFVSHSLVHAGDPSASAMARRVTVEENREIE